MAKKALSISLVAAMLATSNVPVWAAEFSDGTDVEAFSDEATEVVEEVVETDLFGTALTVDDIKSCTFAQNGQAVNGEAVVKKGTATATIEMKAPLTADTNIYINVYDKNGTFTNQVSQKFDAGANVLSVSYTLKESDVNGKLTAYIDDGDGDFVEAGSVKIVETATVLTGKPVIDTNGATSIIMGTKLTAKTDNMGPEGTEFKYQWQATDADGKWHNIAGATGADFTLTDSNLFEKKVRVAVYSGAAYEETKASFSDEVTVGSRKLTNDNTNGGIVTGTTKTYIDIQTNKGANGTEKVFNTDSRQNELTDRDITVTYKKLNQTEQTLIFGKDYTLTYSQLSALGTVNVTVNILPTANTDFTQDTYKGLSYKLVGTSLDGYAINYPTTKSYEYTGKKITPEVTSVTYTELEGTTRKDVTLPASDYTVQEIGPDAGSYPLSVYVKDRGLVTKDANGVACSVTITQKAMQKHDADFTVEIPEQVWKADPTDVVKNAVKNAKIKMYDTVADPNKTNDLLASGDFDITVVNWSDSAIKKSIKITAKNTAKNYIGSIIRDGEVTKSDINEFKAAFLNRLANGNNLIYNGKQQDYLGTILSGNHGFIDLADGTKLFLDRDFTYKLTQGGTNVGDVSYTITGAGIYADTEMILSNAYKIQPATFNNPNHVKDNRKTDDTIDVPFNPALGDKGADIRNYEILGKDVYKAYMVNTSPVYNLTLDKDFWLDSKVNSLTQLEWIPTVAENKVAGHGKNENFRQDASATDRTSIKANLVAKNLSSKDISVQIVDASYNSGSVVTPKIKVVYTAKDGKEYEISSDYYEIKIVRSAVNEGETGKINVVAKTITDQAKYPQMYSGNQMAEFTVGTPSLNGGKILATNGLETLPSVAYSAEQAASTKGIILEEGKYVVKDKSGNIVDPKYYEVSFTDNKKAGTATITVTGKAPYEGSVSATFTITNAMLPSGTVTLMSDKLSKAYTGEEIKLVKGTDYSITGELAALTEGTDYMVSYENAVNVTTESSKAKVKFVGIGSYAGELVKTFDITPAKISAKDISLGDTTYAGGSTIKPAVTITVPGGSTKLVEGTDYTVDYIPAATNVGDKGKVVITYNKDNKNINAADSEKTVEYGVTAKDLKDVTVDTIPDQEVTGSQIKPVLTVMNGSVRMVEGKDYTVTYGTNTEAGEGSATIKPVSGNANYTGEQTVKFNIVKTAPQVGQAMIRDVVVSGNKATAILSGPTTGAEGYDFVIATEEDYKNGRVDISKNILTTRTNFYYVQEGTYYAYCHAWTRGEDGKKVFGDWSNLFKFDVTATTPSTPSIKSVKVSGSTVTVTLNGSVNADGYDAILGTALSKVNGEQRPVNYGTLVKKNQKTTTIKFTGVKKGTYYVGAHAYNRTSEDGKKVFSKWSGSKKITVK